MSDEGTQAEESILLVCWMKEIKQRSQSYKYASWRTTRKQTTKLVNELTDIFQQKMWPYQKLQPNLLMDWQTYWVRKREMAIPRIKQLTSTFGCRWQPSGTSRNRGFKESSAWIKVLRRTLGLKNACGSRYFTETKAGECFVDVLTFEYLNYYIPAQYVMVIATLK